MQDLKQTSRQSLSVLPRSNVKLKILFKCPLFQLLKTILAFNLTWYHFLLYQPEFSGETEQ